MFWYGVVYKATCKITNKSYIGWTTDFKRRKNKHIVDFKKKSKKYFHCALRKYGPDNFEWEIIDWCSNDENGKDQEIYWIEFYNSFHNGFNMTPGGDGLKLGSKISQDAIKKRMGKNNYWFGTTGPMGGKHHSLKAKKKLSRAFSGKNHPMFGKHHTLKSRRKISNGMRKWKLMTR